MSDQGGSDLDVFESLSKKPGLPAGDSKQKTLLGLAAPSGPKGSKAPPPPPSKSVPPPPAPSKAAAPPPPAPTPSVAAAPPAPTPSVASAPPPPAPMPSAAAAPPPPTPSAAAAPPPPAPTPSAAAAPPPPTPSAAAAPPPPPAASIAPPPPAAPSKAAAPPPAPTPSASAVPESDSKPLAPTDTDWDDEDEKTTVFDRSNEESAQALLQKAPAPAAGAPAPSVPARPSAPAPAAAPTPVKAPAAAATSPSVAPAAAAPSVAPAPAGGGSKVGIILGAAAILIAGGAFALLGGGPEKGGLVVSVAGPGGTAVSGVSVLIDGAEKCADSTCKVTDLEPGSYVVKAVADGYRELAGKAYEVQPGEQKAINIELVAEAGATELKVESEASGLVLSLDGKKIGPLPQSLAEIKPGKHKVEITGDFIKPFEKTINVEEGESFSLDPELELATGNVIVKLGEDAKGAKVSLTVNGKRKSLKSLLKNGETGPIKIPNDGKKYAISASRKGYEDFEQELTLTVKEPVQTVTVDLLKEGEEPAAPSAPKAQAPAAPRAPAPSRTPAPRAPAVAKKPAASGAGRLNINSIPVSSIILDGRPLGSTPKVGVSVKAGAHTVVFVHPQHGRKVRSVTVNAGGVATAAVRFP